jgi:hypothetical protein
LNSFFAPAFAFVPRQRHALAFLQRPGVRRALRHPGASRNRQGQGLSFAAAVSPASRKARRVFSFCAGLPYIRVWNVPHNFTGRTVINL